MQTKTQAEDLQNYLTDASNMSGGHAEKLFVPESVSVPGVVDVPELTVKLPDPVMLPLIVKLV